jgi:hypothetical protein
VAVRVGTTEKSEFEALIFVWQAVQEAPVAVGMWFAGLAETVKFTVLP